MTNLDGRSGTLDDVFFAFGPVGSVATESLVEPALGAHDIAINTKDQQAMMVWISRSDAGAYSVNARLIDLSTGKFTGSQIVKTGPAQYGGGVLPRGRPANEFNRIRAGVDKGQSQRLAPRVLIENHPLVGALGKAGPGGVV